MREGTDHFRDVAKWWLCGGVGFGALHATVGIAAVAFAASVASGVPIFPNQTGPQIEMLCSVVASGMVTLFGFQGMAQRHMKAHRRLRPAIEKYDYDETFTRVDVERAYEEGISILDQTPTKRR
jgi:hypothetical protein